jgi:peptidoglycan/LPS O-acetylase OafA/YrhL
MSALRRFLQSERTIMSVETQPEPNRVSVLGLEALTTANSPKGQRIPALDFTKGTLVLLMVLYHWINYFIDPQWKYLFYLRFLTPSFIFISGFMVSHVYLSKYAAADPRLWKRLMTRGLKLIAIFLVLNLVRIAVGAFAGFGFALQNLISLQNLSAAFVTGDYPVAGVKLVSFGILVPISYLLVLLGALMFPYRVYRYTFHITCATLLTFIAILAFAGIHNYILEFVAVGMLGALAGFLPARVIEGFGRHPYWLALAYLCYLVAITTCGVPFLLQIAAVLLNLSMIYLVGARGIRSGTVKTEAILIGKYSLFGYISQIAILQILGLIIHHMTLGFAVLPVSFLGAFVLTIVSVELIDRARTRFGRVDWLYKAVFA